MNECTSCILRHSILNQMSVSEKGQWHPLTGAMINYAFYLMESIAPVPLSHQCHVSRWDEKEWESWRKGESLKTDSCVSLCLQSVTAQTQCIQVLLELMCVCEHVQYITTQDCLSASADVSGIEIPPAHPSNAPVQNPPHVGWTGQGHLYSSEKTPSESASCCLNWSWRNVSLGCSQSSDWLQARGRERFVCW